MNGTIAGERDVQEIISKSRAEFERRRWILITNVPDNVDLEVRKSILTIVNNSSHPSAWNPIWIWFDHKLTLSPLFCNIYLKETLVNHDQIAKVSVNIAMISIGFFPVALSTKVLSIINSFNSAVRFLNRLLLHQCTRQLKSTMWSTLACLESWGWRG